MTDPERPDRGARRRAARIVAVVAIVGVAIGLSIALGVGPVSPTPATASPGASLGTAPAFSDLPLVTVAPTATRAPTAIPSETGAAGASPSPTPAAVRGIRADGVDAPIGKAAHYPGSAWPGDGSNIYIYGHARTGMLITLWRVQVGDPIRLDLADGTSRTYVVTKVLPKVPYDAVKYLEPTPTEQLTVQTSTSYYPTAPRFVVIAVPAP
jgi:hypothetical protein